MASDVAIIVSAKDQATKVLSQVGMQVAAETKRWNTMAQSVSGYNNMMRKAALGVATATVAIGAASIKMAMNAVESENLFRVSTGKMEASARAWSESLRTQLGLNSYELRKNVGLFDVMFKSMGLGETQALNMSEGLTKLSYDMASFYKIDPTDAFAKLRSGITGQARPLKELGIIVDDATTKAYAYSHGIASQGKELTGTEKVLARYGLILDRTSAAQGDLARTIDSPTNKLRILGREVASLATDFGMHLIPAFSHALDALDPYAKQLEKMTKSGDLDRWAANAVLNINKVTDGVAKTVGYLIDHRDAVVDVVKGFVAAWAFTETIAGISAVANSVNMVTRALNAMSASVGLKALGTLSAGAGGLLGIAAIINVGMIKLLNDTTDRIIAWGKSLVTRKVLAEVTPSLMARGAGANAEYGDQAAQYGMAMGRVTVSRYMRAHPPKPPKPPTPHDPTPQADDPFADAIQRLADQLRQAAASERRFGDAFDFGKAKLAAYQSAYDSINELTIPKAIKRADQLAAAITRMTTPGSATVGAASIGIGDLQRAQRETSTWQATQAYNKLTQANMDRAAGAEANRKVAKAAADLEAAAAGWANFQKGDVYDPGHAHVGAPGWRDKLSNWASDASVQLRYNPMGMVGNTIGGIGQGLRAGAGQFVAGMASRVPGLSGAISGAQAGAAGGPVGMAIGALAGLAMQSKAVEGFMTSLGKVLGPIIEAMGAMLTPVLRLLFPPLKWLAQGVLWVNIQLAKFYNSLIDFVDKLFPGDQSKLKINIDDMTKAMDDLRKANLDLTSTTQDTTDSMRNIPDMFKIALVRNQSTAAGGRNDVVAASPPATPQATAPNKQDMLAANDPHQRLGAGSSSSSGLVVNVNLAGGVASSEVKALAKQGVFEAMRQAKMTRYGDFGGALV